MKLIRVPWIRCRTDEAGTVECHLEWKGRTFAILAYSENEAQSWWRELSEGERQEHLGISTSDSPDEPGLF